MWHHCQSYEQKFVFKIKWTVLYFWLNKGIATQVWYAQIVCYNAFYPVKDWIIGLNHHVTYVNSYQDQVNSY